MKSKHPIRLQAAIMIASATWLAAMMPAMAAGSSIPVPANGGTLEGTATLIKAPPQLGAGAYALGMPRDEALAKMKADGMFNEAAGVRPSIGFKFQQLPDHPFIGGSYGQRQLQSGGGESVGLLFTMYPNKPVVSGLARGLDFSPATAPNVGNTLAALRKKYGTESGTGPNALYWVFDYQGHPLSKEQMAELKKNSCLADGPGATGGSTASNIVDTDWMGGKISKGYVEFLRSLGTGQPLAASPACLDTVRIDADFSIRKPSGSSGSWGNRVNLMKAEDWAGAASDLVTALVVTIRDTPLDYSAATVSRNAVLNGGAAEQQKERDAATKRKPNL